MKPLLLTALATAVLGTPAAAQVVGSTYDGSTIEGFANTPAQSFDEYAGRLILVENFAYW